MADKKRKNKFWRKLKKRISSQFIYYLVSFFLLAYGASPFAMLEYYYDLSIYFLLPYLVAYKPFLYILGGVFMLFNEKVGTRYLYLISCANLLTATVPLTSTMYLLISGIVQYHPDLFYQSIGFDAFVAAEIFIISFAGYWTYRHLIKKENKKKKSYLLKPRKELSYWRLFQ